MKVLVINSGSSSLKYRIYDSEKAVFITEGTVEKIGERGSFIRHTFAGKELVFQGDVPNHEKALEFAVQHLLDKEHGTLKKLSEIDAVGHRVVHGGTISASCRIDKNILKQIEEFLFLAPLHNPPNLMGIKVAMKLIPGVFHVAVFDTAFHQTIPKKAYLYALPPEFYEKYGVRRYGFHGTSHKYVSREAAKQLRVPMQKLKMITCHLGAGSSIAAIDGGKSVDTSMGMTPLEGLVMCTRCGDIDPAIPFFLVKNGVNMDELYNLLNEKSGLLGLSGLSKDMREVIQKAESGDERCKLAIDIFCYRVTKYIGAYAAALGGLDVLVFTAGIGSNSGLIRSKICESLKFMGVELDPTKNKNNEREVSAPNSKVKVLVIPTDEAKMIALETIEVLEK